MTDAPLRIETKGRVRSLVLCRSRSYNAITPALRDALFAALDEADRDTSVHVVLLRAEGDAFCAGFALDQSLETASPQDTWDSVVDLERISSFAAAFSKLREIRKPTIAAVQGWCVAGGSDMVFNCDLIICGHSARFGYPPARAWGVPLQPWLWVQRLGQQAAGRYLLTGDEIDSCEAERLGLVWARVPDDQLPLVAQSLADRVAALPLKQLIMMKTALTDVATRQFDPRSSGLLGCLFDGIARNTDEGLAFSERALQVGWRNAVRERDTPFGDYGSKATVGGSTGHNGSVAKSGLQGKSVDE
jgi:enoyl-CoA hydratase